MSRSPIYRNYGAIGQGVTVKTIQRLRDTFLDTMYRSQVSGLGTADKEAEYYSQIENIFLEPSDGVGFSTSLENFFSSLSDFSNDVEDSSVRTSTLSETEALAASIRDTYDRLDTLRTSANSEVRDTVEEINSYTEQIAALNKEIRDAELGGQTASDMRDDRDVLLDNLAKVVNITTNERDDGQVDVLLGGDQLVNGTERRELVAKVDGSIDPTRSDLVEVRFSDNNEAVNVTDGELYGVLQIRDVKIKGVMDNLNTMTSSLIENINNIHSQGNGMEAFSETLSSTNSVNSPYAPLDLANLPFGMQSGSFDIVVYDSTGAIVETATITIDPSTTTGADVESAINAMSHMSALIDGSGALTLTPDSGYSFSFANDTSGALTAFGLNGLFSGTDASNIALSSQLSGHPELLSSGSSLDLGDTGDNTVALALAALVTAEIVDGDSQTVSGYYESTVVQVGIDSKANTAKQQVEQATVDDYDTRRETVSGVNLDEEVTALLQYQRAFQSAARIITVTDQMLTTLLNMAL